MTNSKALRLNDKTAVFIDWANVYGWKKVLKYEPDPKKIYKYLKKYKEIKEINFYYGTDDHPKSRKFIRDVKLMGYRIKTKPVKHIIVRKIKGEIVTVRKCDFDIEIVMDMYAALDRDINSFIFFTGDGDFEPIYKYLIKHNKKIIVVYMPGHLGKEIWQMKKGIFKIEMKKLGNFVKKCPRTYELNQPGRD